MNITLVTETFPPEINGVAMTLDRLVRGLIARGQQLTVIVPGRKERREDPDQSYELICAQGLPLPGYPELQFGLPAHAALHRQWTRRRPAIVHVATEGPLGWSAIDVAHRLEIPVVSSFHTNFHRYGEHYGFGLLQRGVLGWLRHCHNRCLRTFVPSMEMLKRLREQDFHHLSILSRGVDTRLFHPDRRDPDLRRSWGANASTPVAMHVGRIAPEKNIELVLQAYQRMKAVLPDLRLVLVGDGPMRASLERTNPDIHFAGMRTGEDLAAQYASADCFLFASITETYGNVVPEAMASGLPVLAYQYAAPARFIRDEQNGFLASFDDPDFFLSRSEQFAHAQASWRPMGKNARETILPHSWDGVVEDYLQELFLLLPASNYKTA